MKNLHLQRSLAIGLPDCSMGLLSNVLTDKQPTNQQTNESNNQANKQLTSEATARPPD
jgi:hypothetical protein